MLGDLKDVFQVAYAKPKESERNVFATVSECIAKHYSERLDANQRMQLKCHFAEFPHKAHLFPTLDRDEMDALVEAILKHPIPSTSTSIYL